MHFHVENELNYEYDAELTIIQIAPMCYTLRWVRIRRVGREEVRVHR